ncbi:MAG: hypothetical protein ACI4AA_02530 [Lachnospiraceae bacterium]
MDWKMIMNKNRKGAETEKKTSGQAAEILQNGPLGEEIQQYFMQLLPEWNMRLFMDTKLPATNILWVESVTVTAVSSVSAKRKSGMQGRIWHRLTGVLGKSRSLKK